MFWLLALALTGAQDDMANSANWVELDRTDYHGIASMAQDSVRSEGAIRYVRMRTVRPESAIVMDLAFNCADGTEAPIVVYFWFDGKLASAITYRPDPVKFGRMSDPPGGAKAHGILRRKLRGT